MFYAGGSRFSSFVTSGNFNGYSPSQSRHRNLRPPAFTSAHRMGLLHLRQRGGGRFLTTMMLTLNWAGAQNSLSPITALGDGDGSSLAPLLCRVHDKSN